MPDYTFEVASVKAAQPVTGHYQYHMTVKSDPGKVDFINASLTDLIRTAFGVNSYQVEGPPWMGTEKFDVLTRLPAGATQAQVLEMLQELLASRFQLKIHRTTKKLPAYALVVNKGGPSLRGASDAAGATGWSRSMGPEGATHMETKNMTLAALTQLVAGFLDYPVVDRTGLNGVYDVPLDFSPEDLRTGAKLAGVVLTDNPPPLSSGSTIAASLQRVGLRLESRKLQIDLIVVDHLERVPTAN